MPAPVKKRHMAKNQKLGEKPVATLAIKYTASVIKNSFFRPYLSVR